MNELGPSFETSSWTRAIFNLVLAALLGVYAWLSWPVVLSLLP